MKQLTQKQKADWFDKMIKNAAEFNHSLTYPTDDPAGLKKPIEREITATIENGKGGLYIIVNGEDDCAWAVKEEELKPIMEAIVKYLSNDRS
jgi:dsDNA-binding SOS-regulon protein